MYFKYRKIKVFIFESFCQITFKVDKVESLELNNEIMVLEKNENGTFIEELKIVDEYGTVINKGINYYLIDENKDKIEIAKEEYDSLNSIATQSTEVVASTEATYSENTTIALTEATNMKYYKCNNRRKKFFRINANYIH